MKKPGLFKVGTILILIGFIIALVGVSYMFINSYYNVKTYNQAIKENEDGDIVYIHGEFESYDSNTVYLDGIEDVIYINDCSEARLIHDPRIHFEQDLGSDADFQWEVIIKGKIVEDNGEKNIEGLEIEEVGSLVHLYDNNFCPYSIFGTTLLLIIISLIILTIGSLLFFFGYQRALNNIIPPKSDINVKKYEVLPFISIFIGSGFILISFIELALLGFIFISIGLSSYLLILKGKLKTSINENDQIRTAKFQRAIKRGKIGTALVVLSAIIYVLIWYNWPQSYGDSELSSFHYLLSVNLLFLIISLIIFIICVYVDARRYDPETEELIKRIKKKDIKKWIFLVIIIILLITGIFIPLFVQTLFPSARSRSSQIEYQEAKEELGDGEPVALWGDILDYNVVNGSTYVVMYEVWTRREGTPSYTRVTIYTTIIFDRDISDEIPYPGARATLYGTMDTKTIMIDGNPESIRYVKGESIDFSSENQTINILTSILILHIVLLMTIIFFNNRLKELKKIFNKDQKKID